MGLGGSVQAAPFSMHTIQLVILCVIALISIIAISLLIRSVKAQLGAGATQNDPAPGWTLYPQHGSLWPYLL